MKKSIFSILIVLLFLSTSINAYADDIVYVTKTGSCYHIEGCSYLKSSIPISFEDAKASGYYACSRCNPDSNLGERYKPQNEVSVKSNPTPTPKSIVFDAEPVYKPTYEKTVKTNNKKSNDNDLFKGLSYFSIGGCAVYYVSTKLKRKWGV